MRLFPRRLIPLLALAVGWAGTPVGEASSPAGVGNINIRNAASVRRAVKQLVATGTVDAHWTGRVSSGNAGTVSGAYQTATLEGVNIFRKLAGVTPVSFAPTLSAKCALAALMMSANRQLDHAPPPSWTFYSADGAEAAGNSNLFLGFAGAWSIPGYIDDSGAGNEIVGHRRWILWSQSQVMGSGDVLDGHGFQAANALWVLPTGDSPAPAARDGFIAWPYAGMIPNTLVFRRWSFAIPFADFSAATVSVRLGSKKIPTRIVDRISLGRGDNTIVFQPRQSYTASNFQSYLYQAHLKPPRKPVTYTVTVKNVKLPDGAFRDFTYRVIVFPMS